VLIVTEGKNGKFIFGVSKVGEKGQVVIPKDARKTFGINPGDSILIVGDVKKGIALIKVDAEKLIPIKIGRSSELLVGDEVVAIGTPASIDFAGSFAEGAVSYNNRVLKIYDNTGNVQKKMTLIQTNALVNPGNSGCPLINEYGEVVGIISMKLNSTYYEGMCFAIPTDSAMPIINAMKNGSDYEELLYAVSRYPAKLGVTAQDASINNPEAIGVEIVEFSSADYDISRKMKVGDIIVSIDSSSVSSVKQLRLLLDKYSPGETVKLTFRRSGQEMTVYVLLGK
jgi:serine protease Do